MHSGSGAGGIDLRSPAGFPKPGAMIGIAQFFKPDPMPDVRTLTGSRVQIGRASLKRMFCKIGA